MNTTSPRDQWVTWFAYVNSQVSRFSIHCPLYLVGTIYNSNSVLMYTVVCLKYRNLFSRRLNLSERYSIFCKLISELIMSSCLCQFTDLHQSFLIFPKNAELFSLMLAWTNCWTNSWFVVMWNAMMPVWYIAALINEKTWYSGIVYHISVQS